MSTAIIGGVVVVVILLVVLYLFMGGDADGPTVQVDAPVTAEEQTDEMLNQGSQGAGTGVEIEADEEMQQEEPEAVEEEVSEDEPDIDPKSIKSLVGQYTGDSFDEENNVWKDTSGKKNDADEILGYPEVIEDDNGLKYVLGGPEKGVRFPMAVMTTGKKYTMLAVVKYNADDSGGRMFDGYGNGANYVGGHWSWPWAAKPGPQSRNSMSGAHRSGTEWISHNGHTTHKADEWVLVTDQKLSYRVNGIQRSGLIKDEAIVPSQISINYGDYTNGVHKQHWWGQQTPDWSAGEVLFFDEVLDKDTIRKLETYLMKKWKIRRSVREHVGMLNSYRWEKGAWQWGAVFDDCNGAGSCSDQFKAMDKIGFDCGDDGAATFMTFHRHHRDHPNGGNGRFWYYSNCTQGLLPGVREKKTDTINTSDSSSMADKFRKLDVSCRTGGISKMQWENVGGDRMRINYNCSNAPINKQSCTEITARASGTDEIHKGWGSANEYKNVRNNERDPNKGPITALDLQWLDCGRNKVLTDVKYGENDQGMMRLKGTCCALEDE